MSLFRTNIKSALKDDALQDALDKNYAQRLEARDSAFEGLDEDIQTLKNKTHTIRSGTIENLDTYVNQFAQKAGENGFIIHRAADAETARSIVLKLAEQHNASLIAKSKTMVSEEIHLNAALEKAGIEVVETDLGEYIVQLRHEPPSHIITPAVHLRREEVAETFQQELGIPYTIDIPTLTNTARHRLRQTFLNADIGITGVNIGVAETGTICLVTNEGNGRMVTTLPKVHIALLGIERLVPDMESLAQIIKMLPRSSTGQKITVYTQFINEPRRSDEIDGAVERHIIMIDNGRSTLLNSPLEESLLCIRCGACINACPVFREIGGFSYTSVDGSYTPYPGPIGSVLSPGFFGQAEFGHLAQASTLCGACKEACPVDIDLPEMLLRVRSGGLDLKTAQDEARIPEGIPTALAFGLRAFTWASTKPALYALAQKLAGWGSKILFPSKDWMPLPVFSGWGYSKDFPRPTTKTFSKRWLNRDQQKSSIDRSVTKGSNGNSPNKAQNDVVSPEPKTLISRFQKEFEELGGHFTLTTQDYLALKITALLNEKGIGSILAWEEPFLPPGILEALKNDGIIIDYGADPKVKAGLTGVNAGIAETGTIVLTSGKGHPSSTSLLPDIHIAVLHETDIHKNLPQVFKLQEIQDASSYVLISGPSRTADIEMTLTIGVHGPGEIHVFCLTD